MTKLGKYTLVRKIATGGMAEVFLARAEGPMGFQKRVVVKRILPHHLEDQRFVQMFLGEATLAAQLNHPNLVTIFDFGETDGQYYIAMEYIDGPNLRVLSRAIRDHDGPLPTEVAARIVATAAEGLHSAHELRDDAGQVVNLVHRDISPDNILVSRSGTVKVVDFGIAKSSTQLHHTRSNVIKGKLAYMPPEQLAREQLDRRADIFALGVVLYELLAGSMPFDSTSEVSIIQAIMGPEPLAPVRSRRRDVPVELEAIITRCLEKDRARRYATCKELQVDLERFVQASGKVVSTSDLAQLVDHLFPPDWEPTLRVQGGNDDDDDVGSSPTISKPRSAPVNTEPSSPSRSSSRGGRPVTRTMEGAAVDADGGRPHTGMSSTQMRHVPASRTPVVAIVLGVLVLAVAAGGAWVLLRPDVPLAAQLDAGPVAAPAVSPDAAAPAVAAVPADAAVEEPDAAVAVAEALDAAVETAEPVGRPHHPPAQRVGSVEFRIRPWAQVTVDGKSLGQTPFSAPVTLSVGRHKLRLQNSSLGKEVTVDLVVKPGDNVFKYNFKD